MKALLLISLFSHSLNAQWIGYKAPGVPRLKDGKPDMTAKAPRVNGKPDLSGVWHVQPTGLAEMKRLFGDDVDKLDIPGMEAFTISKYAVNVFQDWKPEDVPMRPEAAAIVKRRNSPDGEALPSTHCLPLGIPLATNVSEYSKIVQTPGLTMIVLELNNSYRQIFTDGRKLPTDPSPSWLGYSIGHWEGDTFVVESNGFNDKGWLDIIGHPQSESMRITERYRRRDFGHMDVEVSFDDPKMYTKPFSIKVTHELHPDEDVLEYICNENESDRKHMGLKP